MTTKDRLCPCGSGQNYNSCCQPVINDQACATSPEKLMRSRYSAYVKQNSGYLLASWHRSSRPENLDLFSHPVIWLNLDIHGTGEKQNGYKTNFVDFSCNYLENGQVCTLREVSTFVREGGLWYYLEGECQVTRKNISRNSKCPCGSGKKFKRCCLLLS